MATIVYLHAHPDDEASQTSGSMAKAAEQGHRVVVVYGTNGDHGEVPDDLGDDTVVAYRRREAEASARVLGVARVAWLGYSDSGMTGWEQNSAENAFTSADVDEAGARLAAVLDEEDADFLVGYDWHGGYGHPDHVKVHHVSHRAADLARRRPRLFESTMDRDHLREMAAAAKAAGHDMGFDVDGPANDGNPFGTPRDEITYRIDVRDYLPKKRAALACHASQRTDIERFMAMPEPVFADFFGAEYLIDPAQPGVAMRDGWPFIEQ